MTVTTYINVPTTFVAWARDRSGRYPRRWHGKWHAIAESTTEADAQRRLEIRTVGMTVDKFVLPVGKRPRMRAGNANDGDGPGE